METLIILIKKFFINQKKEKKMNKQFKLLMLSALTLGCASSLNAASTLLLVWATKLNETMTVGDVQNVKAKAIFLEKESDNNQKSVVQLTEKKPNKWTVTAFNPGTVKVVVKKAQSGYSEGHAKGHRHCHHTITVKAKKGSSDNNKAAKKENNGQESTSKSE